MVVISKLFNLLAQPLNGVLVLLLLALLLWPTRPRWAHLASMAALLLLGLTGLLPVPDALLARLERQHAEVPANADLHAYAGMIVLGGAMEPGRLSQQHGQPLLNGSAERMTMAYSLWRRNPELRVVFTGGEGELFGTGPSEAERAQAFFNSMGLPKEALTLESMSQNTYENAIFTRRLPGMDTQKRWLLLTSAWHMPRAMAAFQKAGWNVTAYPVDYRTGGVTPWASYSLITGAEHWEVLLHEYLGLMAYTISGRL